MTRTPHLERILLILEAVAQAETAPNTGEICSATGLPAPTVYRLVRELLEAGLLHNEPDRRFSIGNRVNQLVSAPFVDKDIARIAKPILTDAADLHGAAFFLSRVRGRGVEIIHVHKPQDDKVSYLHPGLGFRPLHACSCAKAVAAFSQRKLVSKAMHSRLKAYTEFTHTSSRDIEAEFEKIRHLGYAECVQELELGICSVAAPVLESGNDCTYSIGATGSLRLFTKPYRKKLGKALMDYARKISQAASHANSIETVPSVDLVSSDLRDR